MHPKSLGQALQPEIVCTVLSISTKALSVISLKLSVVLVVFIFNVHKSIIYTNLFVFKPGKAGPYDFIYWKERKTSVI